MPYFVATIERHLRSHSSGGKYCRLRSLRSLHWRISIVLPLRGNSTTTAKTHFSLNESCEHVWAFFAVLAKINLGIFVV